MSDFRDKNCGLCLNIIENLPNDDLDIILDHVDKYVTKEMFDNELEVNILFQKIVKHCMVKMRKIRPNEFNKNVFLSKKMLLNKYRERKLSGHVCFERLVQEVSNGETCVSCPSKALGSCNYSCAFCPTAKQENGDLKIAKSYNEGQSVFINLLQNKMRADRCFCTNNRNSLILFNNNLIYYFKKCLIIICIIILII